MAAAADALRIQGPDAGGNPVPISAALGPQANAVPVFDQGCTYQQNAPAANTQAQVVIPNVAGKTIYFYGAEFDNIGTVASTAANLTVADGVTNLIGPVSTGVIAANGRGSITLFNGSRPVRITTGNALTVTVPAGGANTQWVLTVYFNQV